MIGVDVRQHRHHGLEMKEGRIAFIRLRHEHAAGPQARVAAKALHEAADNKGGIKARGVEERRHQACGRGLSVGARYGDAVAVAHELAQHFGPGHHGNARLPSRLQLRVLRRDRRGHHHHVGARHLFRHLPQVNRGPKARQARRGLRRLLVRTGNDVALIEQHLRNATHAGTANANKMDMANPAHLGHGVGIAAVGDTHAGTSAGDTGFRAGPGAAPDALDGSGDP